jgi:hypothetical protein
MGDDEQIRLLTEIRDTLRAQAQFEREYVKKRGRSMIVIFVVFLLLGIFGFYIGNKSAQDAQRRIDEQQQKMNNPGL